MNYHHLYHAGNFADVFKHIVLVALLQSLQRKSSPYYYLDTHAGAGQYDLSTARAAVTKEYRTGIDKVMRGSQPPLLVNDYLACVQQFNRPDRMNYPGSPSIARYFLRPQDRMMACEQHRPSYRMLNKQFRADHQVTVQQTNGYLNLTRLLPPRERRGLVFIDPSYEQMDEWAQVARLLPRAVKRWETGLYAVWYPLKERRLITRLQRLLQAGIARPLLAVELSIYPEDVPIYLNGSGLLIVNPPWQFKEKIEATLPWLWEMLSMNKQGHYRVYHLINS